MRIWKIQGLFDKIHKDFPKAKKHVRLIHICSNCGWRTPEIAPISVEVKEISMKLPVDYEIKNHGFCDKCNRECWAELKTSMGDRE